MGDVWNLLCGAVVDVGPTRQGDLDELVFHVHAIQRAVGAQAAARVYPLTFRRLGSTIEHPPVAKP